MSGIPEGCIELHATHGGNAFIVRVSAIVSALPSANGDERCIVGLDFGLNYSVRESYEQVTSKMLSVER